MKNLDLKSAYFLKSALKLIGRKSLACPSCGSSNSTKIKTKYLVMTLMRCNSCKLLFRVPTTTPAENEKFYQRAYQQGFTTEMPFPKEVARLKAEKFRNTEKDYTPYIDVLKALGMEPRSATILDFGCSWGYGSWQIKEAGYSVRSFEISRPRCEYAIKHMNVEATWNLENLNGPFDVFFSSHVIEHVPSVNDIISLAKNLLKPGGYFIAFTPNGSQTYRKLVPSNWMHAWSIVHPNLLDEKFYEYAFHDRSFIIGSNPYDTVAIAEWSQQASHGIKQNILNLEGNELLCIAKMPR